MLQSAPPSFHLTARPRTEDISLVAWIVSFSAGHRLFVLALALAATLAAGFFATQHFAISTDLNRLISPDLPWRQREIVLGEAFPQRSDMILGVLDAANPDVANKAALELEQALRPQKQFFSGVNCLEASDFFRREGLLYLSPKELSERMEQLIEAQPFLGALAQDPSLRGLAGAMRLMAKGGGEAAGLAKPLTALAIAVERATAGKVSDFSWSTLFSGAPPTTQDKRRFIQVKPVLDYSDLEPGAAAAESIRATAKRLG